MALVTDMVRRADIPHEPGEWMELKRLSWRQLEKAEEIQSDNLLPRMKKMGGELIGALQALGKQQEQDPATKYDRGSVLGWGIVKWSYDAEVNKDNIGALDKTTADWAFREILSLNEPRTEDERKND